MNESEAVPRAGAREWVGLAVLVLPCVLVSMDMSVLLFALPFLSADLEPSSAQLLWIMDIYGFLLAGLLITMGTVGDRIGRRRLLLIGAATFGTASVLAAFSSTAEMLIATRALLGVAGATLAPSTLSLIRNMFHDARQRTAAIGMWTAGFAGGAMLGPIVGGLLLENLWWGSVFLINVPVMVLLLVLGPVLLPEYRDPSPGRFDLISAVLSLAAVLPVIYGVKKLAEDGVGQLPILSIGVGLVVGFWFVRRQRRLSDPMIDLRLFGERAFGMSITTNMLALFAMMGSALFSSQYLQLVLGMRPFTAALWSLPGFAAMMVGTVLGATLARSVRPGFVIGAGLVIAAIGSAVITQVGVDSLALLLVAGGVTACGIGMVAALATDLVVASAPPQRAGAASALSETGAEFGGALGMAVLGSVGAAVYRDQIIDTVPTGLPNHAMDVAQDTLGGAVAAAGQLPEQLGTALLTVAREAFTAGLRTTALAAAVILGGTAILATAILRHVRNGQAGGPPSSEEQGRAARSTSES